MHSPEPETVMVAEPDVGRRFSRSRTVRLGDVDHHGSLRLDAVARYSQDLANDDSIDGGLTEAAAMAWVVRKTAIEQRVPAQLREDLSLTTWCSGVGSRWAERRTAIRGDRGGHIDVATVWVHVHPESGVPTKLPAEFDDLYAEAALGRKIRARLVHQSDLPVGGDVMPWPVRVVDIDVLGHVNNAATWAIAEEFGRQHDDPAQPWRAEIEYRSAIPAQSTPAVTRVIHPTGTQLWVHVGNELCTTIIGAPLNETVG